MSTSLLSKIAFWQKSPKSHRVLGVYVGKHSLWVYQHDDDIDAQSAVEFPVVEEDWQATFSAITQHMDAAKLQLVLSNHYYQLLTVDKPNVEASEIDQALLWSIKDMVSIPVTQIHLDYFESPVANNKLTVAVVDHTLLASMVMGIVAAGFEVNGISIEELAISNLFDNDNAPRLVIQHTLAQELLLTVVKAGEPYMQRRIRGFNELDKISAQDLAYGVADNLSLEIQRSMDYFESQLRQSPVASIDFLVDGARSALVTLVAANFNQTVREIECKTVGAKMAALALAEAQRESA